MRKFHAVFGLVIVIVFLLTGQYMDKYLQHLHGMPDGPRMLYRTRHIFIFEKLKNRGAAKRACITSARF